MCWSINMSSPFAWCTGWNCKSFGARTSCTIVAKCRAICRRCNLAVILIRSGPRILGVWRRWMDTRMNGSQLWCSFKINKKSSIVLPLLWSGSSEIMINTWSDCAGMATEVFGLQSLQLVIHYWILFVHFDVTAPQLIVLSPFNEVRRSCVHDWGQGQTFSQCGWRLRPQSWLPALLWGQPQP